MDEIAYIDEAYKVNIVDRNGNHRILASDLTNLYPLFNKTGQFITTLQSEVLSYPYVFGRYTLSSSHRDTLYQGYMRYSILASADDEILFVSQSGDNNLLTIGSFDGVTPQDIVDLSAYEIVNARHFTADSIAQNIYFCSLTSGLYRTSRSGQSPELLIEYCSNIRLTSPTISPDGRHLIVEKIMREQLHNEVGSVAGEIRESSQIAVLDLTTFELETLLP